MRLLTLSVWGGSIIRRSVRGALVLALLNACSGGRPSQSLPDKELPQRDGDDASVSAVERQNTKTAEVGTLKEDKPASADSEAVTDSGELEGADIETAVELAEGDLWILPEYPFANLTDEERRVALKKDMNAFGALSFGLPHAGHLLAAIQLPENPRWKRMSPYNAYGTGETIDALKLAVDGVWERFGESPILSIGDLSAQKGGRLSPHLSHQAGRDVDVGFYYSGEDKWYARGNSGNLDVARNWWFLRTMINGTDMEFVLLDRSLHPLLEQHALEIGEDPEWVATVFHGKSGGRPALVRHAPGHGTHFHFRFFSPTSRENARLCYPILVKEGLLPPPNYRVAHIAKKGDSLQKLARIYGVSVGTIRKENGMRGYVIFAKKTYYIPKQGLPPADKTPTKIRQRFPAPFEPKKISDKK